MIFFKLIDFASKISGLHSFARVLIDSKVRCVEIFFDEKVKK